MERNVPILIIFAFLLLYDTGIFSICLIENVNWTIFKLHFLLVNNIEWCQPTAITIHCFIYEKVQLNSIITAVCGQLWLDWVELDWYITPSSVIYSYKPCCNLSNVLGVGSGSSGVTWLIITDLSAVTLWLMILFITPRSSFTDVPAV